LSNFSESMFPLSFRCIDDCPKAEVKDAEFLKKKTLCVTIWFSESFMWGIWGSGGRIRSEYFYFKIPFTLSNKFRFWTWKTLIKNAQG